MGSSSKGDLGSIVVFSVLVFGVFLAILPITLLAVVALAGATVAAMFSSNGFRRLLGLGSPSAAPADVAQEHAAPMQSSEAGGSEAPKAAAGGPSGQGTMDPLTAPCVPMVAESAARQPQLAAAAAAAPAAATAAATGMQHETPAAASVSGPDLALVSEAARQEADKAPAAPPVEEAPQERLAGSAAWSTAAPSDGRDTMSEVSSLNANPPGADGNGTCYPRRSSTVTFADEAEPGGAGVANGAAAVTPVAAESVAATAAGAAPTQAAETGAPATSAAAAPVSASPAPAAAAASPAPAAAADATAAPPTASTSAAPLAAAADARPGSAASAADSASSVAAPVTGGAAILARLRAQKAASAASAPSSSQPGSTATAPKAAPPPRVVFAYASQTGTASEIARNLCAEAVERKMNAEVLSLNELGFQNLRPEVTPILVVVASSTGDGDPPDNSAATYVSLKKQHPAGLLQGMRFTVLGLGDSNYTRFMAVSRTLRTRLLELGGEMFYPHAEADEVEGIENVAEPWMEGLWEPLSKALGEVQAGRGAAGPAAGAAGVPPAAAAADKGQGNGGPAAAGAPVRAPAGAADKDSSKAAVAPTASTAAVAAGNGVAGAGTLEAAQAEATRDTEGAVEAAAAVDALAAAAASVAAAATVADGAAANGGLPDRQGGEAQAATGPAANGIAADADEQPGVAADADEQPGVAAEAEAEAKAAAGAAGAAPAVAKLNLSAMMAAAGGPSGSLKGTPTRRTSVDSPRGNKDSPTSAMADSLRRKSLSHKPSSVMFPKREEATVLRKDEQSYGLNLGKAPIGSDLKGAPALLPCRVKVSFDRSSETVAKVKALEASRPTPQDLQYRDPEGVYSPDKPFWAEVSDARYETAYWSDRKVLHLQLELADSGMAYEAGDAVGVLPTNPPELVAHVIKKLKLLPDDVFNVRAIEGGAKALAHLPCPCTVSYALSHCVDLTSAPKKSLLRTLAEHCSDSADKRTLMFFTSKAGREAYQHEIMEHQPSLYDLLERFPSCSPPFDALLDALPPLLPRLYSVTTSSAYCPDKVQVAMSVVRFKTRYGTRSGIATTWLDRLTQQLSGEGGEQLNSTFTRGQAGLAAAGPIRVPIILKRSADFKPPQDLSKPVIMIGPGTGVAPFRGFLQNRRALLQRALPDGVPDGQLPDGVAPAWLYFGCRREDEDYLYKDDLQAFVQDRTLTCLKVAFSRAKAEKVYVQDLIRQDASEVAALVDAGAYVFVCGDGAAMAKDVHAALLAAVKERGGLSDEDAAQYMAALVQQRRYIRDVWS